MIFPLFRRSARPDTISTLYGTIVAQARLACFYREYAVADTVNGRFDLLVLHLAMVLDRLEEDPQLQELGQAVFDRFCQDMDHNLREMGVGDLSVPKEMQRMGEAFYGRAQAYRTAMRAVGEEALAEVVVRNIYGGVPPIPAAPARLAAYIREVAGELKAQSPTRLMAGEIRLPNPAAVIVEDKTNSTED
jgi:cytochrome b pre-mRNA-processing protein 3